MAFSTIGVAKQKGGSVGASSLHNGRERETPNADPERTHLNRVLIGDDRSARDRVREIIDEHGGKPRRDSVEAVELLLSASHEYFEGRDGEIDEGRLERWVERSVRFLGDRGNCGICAKAVLHLDERTPHIHAHMVPVTEDGRLSATHFLDGRKKVKELHTRYNSYVKDLGLERGREGSRATHQRQAAERIEAAERTAQEKIVEGLRVAEDRFDNLHRSAQFLVEENGELRRGRNDLLQQRNDLHQKLLKERDEKLEYAMEARVLGDRLTDIPMPEVMQHLGYQGEQHGQSHLYRGDHDVVAMRVEEQKAYDSNNQLICRNSVDLVVHMREINEGVEGFSKDEAVEWLRDEFGDRRAEGAALVNRQHEVLEIFERRREEHERSRSGQERSGDVWRAMGREDGFERMQSEQPLHDRDEGFSFDR